MNAWNNPPLSRTERFFINAAGWLVVTVAGIAGFAIVGLAIEAMLRR